MIVIRIAIIELISQDNRKSENMITDSNAENCKKADLNASFEILRERIKTVLETYANVHRGSGYKSLVTTSLYEKAREIVLDFLHLSSSVYVVIFCTRYRATKITGWLNTKDYRLLTSAEFGLPLGVHALAVRKKALSRKIPFIAGGGTTKLYSKNWIVNAGYPEFYEAGTPAIINCIAFARALKMIEKSGDNIFRLQNETTLSATELFLRNDGSLTGEDLLDHLRETMIGKNTMAPAIDGFKPFVNLDSSASTPAFEEGWLAHSKTLFQPVGIQTEIIAEAGKICAEVLGVPESNYEIIFTSNTTESINFVAECLAEEKFTDIEPVVLITDLEHSSNDLPWRQIHGWQVNRLPVNKQGFWDLTTLEKVMNEYNGQKTNGRKRIKMVAVSGASNVLGSCNNLEETSRIVHKFGALLLVDGAQLVAHREINISKNNIDFFAFSGHKIYAPFGAGVLVMKKGALATDEKKLALFKVSGNENPGGIAALAKSLQLLKQVGYKTIVKHEEMPTRKTLTGLSQINDVRIFGLTDPDSSEFKNKTGVIGFDIKNMAAGSVAKKLSYQAGIGVRFGCHCAHVLIKFLLDFTPSLEQFQRVVVLLVPPLKLQGFTRVSFGIETTENDVDLLLTEIQKIAGRNKTPDFKTVKKLSDETINSITQRVFNI